MEFGELIAEFFVKILFPIIGSILMVIVGNLLMKIGKKYNLDISEKDKKYVEELTVRAIGYAEEFAVDKAKTSTKLQGNEKLELAVSWLLKKVPEIDREQAKDCIIATLSEIKGVGATGDKTFKIEG